MHDLVGSQRTWHGKGRAAIDAVDQYSATTAQLQIRMVVIDVFRIVSGRLDRRLHEIGGHTVADGDQ